jgi:hypothetical protein
LLGQRHSPGQAVEQLRADLVLQYRDLSGDSRLRVPQCSGGGGDRAVVGNRAEHFQEVSIHVAMLTTNSKHAKHSLVA